MSEQIEYVKAAGAYLRDLAERFQRSNNGKHADTMREHADHLEDAAERLIELEGLTSALPPDLGNIHDLPPELLGELSVAKTDELEDQLVTVINAYGGEASLDQILVGLYRKFGVVQKRRFVQNKLYRMSMVFSVQGKKGVYTTDEAKMDEKEIAEASLRPGAANPATWGDDEDLPF